MGDKPDIAETKLTFIKHCPNSVSAKIGNFQRMTESGMCLLGSGCCGFHNEKLERNVQTKRMSVRGDDNDCVLRWEETEIITLVCPGARQQRIDRFCDYNNIEVSPSDGAGESKNHKNQKLRESLS